MDFLIGPTSYDRRRAGQEGDYPANYSKKSIPTDSEIVCEMWVIVYEMGVIVCEIGVFVCEMG